MQYQASTCETGREPIHAAAWDAFVENAPGGHHVQTTRWARLKYTIGWRSLRNTLTDGHQVIGGFQMLVRRLPVLGSCGYVPKGPLAADPTSENAKQLVLRIQQAALENKIQLLLVQPPDHGHAFADELVAGGFRESPTQAFPVATTVADLTLEEDELLARMTQKRRYNVRVAQRKGVTVREGNSDDLEVFYQCLRATAERQKFEEFSLDYYREFYRLFAPRQQARLFVAEYDNEPLSALIVVAFGDTVVFKRGGWLGKRGDLHPNEIMHWAAICWAKRAGYRYYDLEGIDESAAKAILDNKPHDQSSWDPLTRFKLSFGGNVRLNPATFGFIRNPILRCAHDRVYRPLSKHKLVTHAITHLKFLRR